MKLLILLLLSLNLYAGPVFYEVEATHDNRSCDKDFITYCPTFTLFSVQKREAMMYLDRLCFELKNMKGLLYKDSCGCYQEGIDHFIMRSSDEVQILGFKLTLGDVLVDECYWDGLDFYKQEGHLYDTFINIKAPKRPTKATYPSKHTNTNWVKHLNGVNFGR